MKNNHKAILLIAFTMGLALLFLNTLEKKEVIIMNLSFLYGIYYTKILNYLDNDK